MNVVHIAITPLAGAPLRICRALRRSAGVNARLIVRDPQPYGARTFPLDLVWERDKADAMRLIDDADLLVLHNQVGPDGAYFAADLDLESYRRAGKPMARQLHSPVPFLVEHGPWRSEHDLMSDTRLPQLVIAQGQERMYPNAAPVPNVVEISRDKAALARPHQRRRASDPIRICFSPTSRAAADADRWSTKGRDETLEILRSFERDSAAPVSIDLIEDAPFEEAQARQRLATISIDEVITGNAHLVSFESLAAGIPTIAHLDVRLRAFFMEFTGADWLPWIEANPETLRDTLAGLIEDAARLTDIGERSSRWIREYWSEERAAAVHRDRYAAIIRGEDPGRGRLDLRRFATWWSCFGVVEHARWETHRNCMTAKRLARARRLDAAVERALSVLDLAPASRILVLCDEPGAFTSSSSVPGRARLEFATPPGAALPELDDDSLDAIVIVESLIHREPPLAAEFIARARRSARRAIAIVERMIDNGDSRSARPGQFRLDSYGGWWNHDWRSLLPDLKQLSPCSKGSNDQFIATAPV